MSAAHPWSRGKQVWSPKPMPHKRKRKPELIVENRLYAPPKTWATLTARLEMFTAAQEDEDLDTYEGLRG